MFPSCFQRFFKHRPVQDRTHQDPPRPLPTFSRVGQRYRTLPSTPPYTVVNVFVRLSLGCRYTSALFTMWVWAVSDRLGCLSLQALCLTRSAAAPPPPVPRAPGHGPLRQQPITGLHLRPGQDIRQPRPHRRQAEGSVGDLSDPE